MSADNSDNDDVFDDDLIFCLRCFRIDTSGSPPPLPKPRNNNRQQFHRTFSVEGLGLGFSRGVNPIFEFLNGKAFEGGVQGGGTEVH